MPNWDYKWLLYGALFVLIPFSSLFVIGCYLLGDTPWGWWQKVWGPITPVQYDGKEPYAQWAAKMEQARRLQEKEDA